MENPITELKEVVKGPVELASINFPSARLVVLLFTYKQHIYGALIFIVITLAVSLSLKRVSHDLFNWGCIGVANER